MVPSQQVTIQEMCWFFFNGFRVIGFEFKFIRQNRAQGVVALVFSGVWTFFPSCEYKICNPHGIYLNWNIDTVLLWHVHINVVSSRWLWLYNNFILNHLNYCMEKPDWQCIRLYLWSLIFAKIEMYTRNVHGVGQTEKNGHFYMIITRFLCLHFDYVSCLSANSLELILKSCFHLFPFEPRFSWRVCLCGACMRKWWAKTFCTIYIDHCVIPIMPCSCTYPNTGETDHH